MTPRCNICREDNCSPNTHLMGSLAYFSGITQRTLSAFHRAGIDASLLDEIDNIKEYLTKLKPLILVDATPDKDGLYKRRFACGHTDLVPHKHIFDEKYLPQDSDISELKHILDKSSMSPISTMSSTVNLDKIDTPRKKINKPTESIFFMQ